MLVNNSLSRLICRKFLYSPACDEVSESDIDMLIWTSDFLFRSLLYRYQGFAGDWKKLIDQNRCWLKPGGGVVVHRLKEKKMVYLNVNIGGGLVFDYSSPFVEWYVTRIFLYSVCTTSRNISIRLVKPGRGSFGGKYPPFLRPILLPYPCWSLSILISVEDGSSFYLFIFC